MDKPYNPPPASHRPLKEIRPGQVDMDDQTPENPWIETFTGRHVHLLNPDPAEVSILDIAHALAFQCRFTGHCLRYLSVAEHSILVSEIVPRCDALWGLLHDAAEAYLHDMSRPLKHNTEIGGLYLELEGKWMFAIAKRFDLPLPPSSISVADNAVLGMELAENMRGGRGRLSIVQGISVSNLYYYNEGEAEVKFLERFIQLGGRL